MHSRDSRLGAAGVVDRPTTHLLSPFAGMLLAIPLILVLGAALVRVEGETARMVNVTEWRVDPANPPDLPLHPGGFDGQFYWRSAVAPLATQEFAAGIRMDAPALRHGRILYPLLGRGFGELVGDVPLGLILANIVAALALGAGVWRVRRHFSGPTSWMPVLIALFPGFVYTITFDLTELVAAALIVHALADRRSNATSAHARSVVLLCLAALTRETSIVFIVAAIAADVFAARGIGHESAPDSDAETSAAPEPRRNMTAGALALSFVPLVIWGAWQSIVRVRFGEWAFLSAGSVNTTGPFGGLANSIGRYWPVDSSAALLRVASAGMLLAALVWGFALIVPLRRATPGLIATCGDVMLPFVMCSALMTLLSSASWDGATSFLRHSGEFWVAAMLWIPSGTNELDRIRHAEVSTSDRHGRIQRTLVMAAALAVAVVFMLNALAQVSKFGSVV